MPAGSDKTQAPIEKLAEIANPFVYSFMYEKARSESDAYDAYVEEAKKQGMIHCTKQDYQGGWFAAIMYNK